LVPVDISAPSGDLTPGQVIVRLSAAAICGSDIAHYGSAVHARSRRAGFPVHECVGRVVASSDPDVATGDRVLAMPTSNCGLMEMYTARSSSTHRIRCTSLTDADATLIQPLATVLHAVAMLGDVSGARVAIIGLGPIGLLCAHLLRSRGADTVIGIDPVDRSEFGTAFGLGTQLCDVSAAWAASGLGDAPADICVEAVGHQQRTLADAVVIARPGGTILALGIPDEPDYTWPYERFFRKNLTLRTSVTPPWHQLFGPAEDYLVAHLPTLSRLITHRFDIADVDVAYRTYERSAKGRAKVVVTAESWNSDGH
jgi:threonine dehydrogenase-like Zn-dependent dehydrogenase